MTTDTWQTLIAGGALALGGYNFVVAKASRANARLKAHITRVGPTTFVLRVENHGSSPAWDLKWEVVGRSGDLVTKGGDPDPVPKGWYATDRFELDEEHRSDWPFKVKGFWKDNRHPGGTAQSWSGMEPSDP